MWRRGWCPGVATVPGRQCSQVRSSKTVCLHLGQCGDEVGSQVRPVPGGQCSQVRSSKTVCLHLGQCGEEVGSQERPVPGGQCSQVRCLRQFASTLTNVEKVLCPRVAIVIP
jgi:hypothetical protein